MSQFSEHADSDGVVISVRERRSTGRFRVFVPESNLPSRTKQGDAKGADINFIVARYKKTGELPIARRAAIFGEMNALDLKEAMDIMTTAQQSFAMLPSASRSAYQNDPALLLADLDNASKDPEAHRRLFKAGIFSADYVEPEAPKGSTGKKSSTSTGKKSGFQPDLPMEDDEG